MANPQVVIAGMMFTMLGAVMKVKKFALPPPPVVEPKYGVPA